LAKAVRDFVENEGQGQLPLSGKLPDMKADTMKYIGLQNVYRQKALFDLNAVKERVKILLKDGDQIISDEIVQTFCKNTGHIKVIQYRSFSAYYGQVKKIGNFIL
jgi:amyloid beta precursor protein binding protein 1